VQGLNNIHESDTLRHFVEEVVFHYGDIELVGPEPEKVVMEELEGDDECGCAEVQEQMGESKDEYDDEEISDAVPMVEWASIRLGDPEEKRRFLEAEDKRQQIELKKKVDPHYTSQLDAAPN
jgi:hypothetical protein